MDIKVEKHTIRIIYSFFISSTYLFLTIIQDNVFFSFFLTLNIFYFSRELLSTNLYIQEEQVESAMPLMSKQKLFESEREILPENIKKILRTSLEVSYKEESIGLQEQTFIDALQKAERLIEEKITLLQSKQTLKKSDVNEIQEELKEAVVNALPEIETATKEEIWENWNPLNINEKLLNQEIYCIKCKKLLKVKQMNYEIQTKNDYFEVVTTHEEQLEQHVNTTRITKESYEILSKPILTVRPLTEMIIPQEIKA